jgi:hypothetical protein
MNTERVPVDAVTRQRVLSNIVRAFHRKRELAKRQKNRRALLFASLPDTCLSR